MLIVYHTSCKIHLNQSHLLNVKCWNAIIFLNHKYQSTTVEHFHSNALVWLNNVLFHVLTVSGRHKSEWPFFQMCSRYNMKTLSSKCSLFSSKICWCERLTSAKGLGYNPRRMKSLLTMEPPNSAAHLKTFLFAALWVAKEVPNFTNLIMPPINSWSVYMFRPKTRTNLAVSRILLSVHGWEEIRRNEFHI